MKKFRNIILSGLLFLGLNQSCKKDFIEGYDVDPNRPLDVSMDVLLTSSEAYTIYVTSSDLPRITNVIMQQMTGADRQFLAIDRYVIAGSDFENMWEIDAYGGAMKDLKILIEKAGTESPHYSGVAKILMALNLATLSDAFNDIPYTEALMGSIDAGLEPSYDSQESIFQAVQNLLDEGITDVNASSSVLSPGSDDFYFSGNLAMWTKFAHSLKARYYNRISNKGNFDSDIMNSISNGFGSGEGCLPTFASTKPQSNPWYQFIVVDREGYINLSGTMIDTMTARGDTNRRNVYQNTSGFYFQASSPSIIFHENELLFIEAETMLRTGSSDADVQAKLNDAVLSHFSMIGLDGSDYVSNHLIDLSSLSSTDEKLEAIIWEKYIASYTTNEAWADYRRTGYPTLTPASNATGGIGIPSRFPYPQSEYLYNSNTPSNVEEFPASLTTPVWWAQ